MTRGGHCDYCKKWIDFGEDFIGDYVQCPHCGSTCEVKRSLGNLGGRFS